MNTGQTAKAHHHFKRKPPFVLVLTSMILIRPVSLRSLLIIFSNISFFPQVVSPLQMSGYIASTFHLHHT